MPAEPSNAGELGVLLGDAMRHTMMNHKKKSRKAWRRFGKAMEQWLRASSS